MNILCINHEYPPIGGGGATACKNILRLYARQGHQVTLVTAGYQALLEEEEANNVRIHRLRCRRSSQDHSSFLEMLSFLWSAFRVAPKLVKREKFDVCHIFFGIPTGPLGWYLKKRFGLPYIVRLGGGDVPGTQKRFDKIYVLLGPFLKRIWRQSFCVVANSQGIMERAMRFSSDARFQVIPNGINLEDFPLVPPREQDGMLRLVSTCRIVERKGLQHMVDALPALMEQTGGNVQYTIVGDGPYREMLVEQAKRLGVADCMRITGFVPFEQVQEELRHANLFVYPSHWEGMPNVVLEAMASGLPIVMTSCEGSEELVTDNGYIIDLRDNIPARLTEKILQLHRDPALLRTLGDNSARNVRKNFTWEKTARDYLELMEKAAEGRMHT